MDGIKEAFSVIFGLIAAVLLLLAAFRLAGYALKGAALSRMAKNAGLPHPALAWVPVANNYLLGVLCDRAVLVQKGKSRGFSILLPVWDVLGLLFGRNLLAFLNYYDGLDTRFMGDEAFFTLHRANPMDLLESLVAAGILAAFGIALWHLYRDYDPERAALFTVLSVVFGSVAQGAVLFAIRDRRPLSAGELIVPPQRRPASSPWTPPTPAPPPPEPPYGPEPTMPPFRWKDPNKK